MRFLVILLLLATALGPPGLEGWPSPIAHAQDEDDADDAGDDAADDSGGDAAGGDGADNDGADSAGDDGAGDDGDGADGDGDDGDAETGEGDDAASEDGTDGRRDDRERRRDAGASRGGLIDRLFGGGADRSDDGYERLERELVAFGLDAADRAALAGLGFRVIAEHALDSLGGTLSRLLAPPGLALDDALAAARRAAPGATMDANHLYAAGGGCAGPSCWAVEFVALAAESPAACARGAPIAIIDTAVDRRHPALEVARVETKRFLADGVRPAPPDHGTAIAALLVGRPAPGATALAPGATLLAAEAIGMREENARADAASIVQALDWAMTRGARVIGLSLAGGPNLLLARATEAASRRANLIAAAGNGGPRAKPAYPAAYPSVTAIAAVDGRKRPWRGGNRGPYVELAAPGVDVASAGPGGGTARWTGTSFAVPFAMAAALRARAETGGDPEAARRLLARAAEDLGPPGRDDALGHGLVRAPGARCY